MNSEVLVCYTVICIFMYSSTLIGQITIGPCAAMVERIFYPRAALPRGYQAELCSIIY